MVNDFFPFEEREKVGNYLKAVEAKKTFFDQSSSPDIH